MARKASATVEEYLNSLRLGEPQALQNVIVFPIKSWLEGSPHYLGLGEAISAGVVRISEIPGRDPATELEIVNLARHPILMLKGEELAASGRRWSMSGTILIKEDATTLIPPRLIEPVRGIDVIEYLVDAARTPRRERTDEQRTAQTRFARFSVDHSSIWSKIDILREPASERPTVEDREAIASESQKILKESRAIFRWTPRQKGVLFAVNDEPVGFEVVSRAGSFAKVHPKIVKDHVTAGLWKGGRVETHVQKAAERARWFLEDAARCSGDQRGSPGIGFEYHCAGPGMRGTALLYEDRVIHLEFDAVRSGVAENDRVSAGVQRRL